jgi:Mycobacterium 19 kDa lipoprotein antigen
MTNPDGRHGFRLPAARRRIVLGAARLGAVVLGASLSACSTMTSESASPPSSTPASANATVMVDQHMHSFATGVACTNSAAKPNAKPMEFGDLTTRIGAHDDSASFSLALSDETPPTVDGFAISLKVGAGQYQMPYQPPQSATQVQATKKGNTYTVAGSGQATGPGQAGMHQVAFGIRVTCS